MLTAPRGTRDIIAPEADKWRFVEGYVHEVCGDFGYNEIRTPLFEHSELFERLGEATDLVQKETYTFNDRGNRSITLRPEGTAPVARAYLEHKLDQQPQPVKLYYIGAMFRYERPQSGRYRQHHQFGAELMGSQAPTADAEIIMLALEFYRRLGLHSLRLDINSIGCPECRPGYRSELRAYIDRFGDKLCKDCRSRVERNVLRVLDCKQESCRELVQGVPRTLDHVCAGCREHHEQLLELLSAQDIDYRDNPRLVRGLDYYTKTVFEVISTAMGEDRALGGGGRYDGLIEELGGSRVPGVGFGLGLERLLLTLEEEGQLLPTAGRVDVFVAAIGERAAREGFSLVCELRRRSVSADIDHARRGLKGQMKHADRLNAGSVVIIGDDELQRGTAVVRDMRTGEQREVGLSCLADEVGELVKG